MKNAKVVVAIIALVGAHWSVNAFSQQTDCSDPANYTLQECRCMEGALPMRVPGTSWAVERERFSLAGTPAFSDLISPAVVSPDLPSRRPLAAAGR